MKPRQKCMYTSSPLYCLGQNSMAGPLTFSSAFPFLLFKLPSCNILSLLPGSVHFYDLLLSAGSCHPGHIWTPTAHFAVMAESHSICSPFVHSKFWLLLKFSISFSRQPLAVDIAQEPLKLFYCISWPKNLYVR